MAEEKKNKEDLIGAKIANIYFDQGLDKIIIEKNGKRIELIGRDGEGGYAELEYNMIRPEEE